MRRSKRRQRVIRNRIIFGCVAVLVIAIVLILISILKTETIQASFSSSEYVLEYSDNEVVPEGMYVGKTLIGGMTKSAARDKLSTIYRTPTNVDVVIRWGDYQAKTNLSSLGVITDIDDAIDRCISIGLNRGLIQRYKTSRDLAACSYHAELIQTIDKDKTEQFLQKNLADLYDEPAVDASIQLDANGNAYVKDGTSGSVLNIPMTICKIQDAFLDSKDGDTIIIDAVISDSKPDITADMLSDCTDKLGSSTTVYLKTEYKTDRASNVELAASRVGGRIVKPGEQISASELMGTRTEENGYKMGVQYVSGVPEDSIGGGVCQVATTLYQALLYSEIKIDERHSHSLTVGYAEPSLDAAISEGAQDLVFTNNLENNIYIYSYTDGKNLTFTIFGKEYRDSNRSVEYISVVDEEIVTETKYVDDPTLEEGQKKVDGDNHNFVKSHMDKVVYENGVEVSRETIHYDTYQASQQTIYVGTKTSSDDTGETTEENSTTATTETTVTNETSIFAEGT